MEIALKRSAGTELISRIKSATDLLRLSKIEEMFSQSFENLPENSPIDYVGELNKNDVMF